MTTFRVGNVTVRRIEEVLELGYPPEFMLVGFDPAMLARYPVAADSRFYDSASGRSLSSIHSWLVEIDGKTILIDTCSGNGKARALPIFQRFHMLDLPYLDNLAAAGVSVEDVDIVFCTHLHIDHVGWNTRRDGDRWVPTFPNARYIFGRAEYEHWTGDGKGPLVFPDNAAVIEDSVLPVAEAGMMELINAGQEIVPGLRVEAAPGHTMDQLIVKYESADGCFVISADVLHHPVQVYEPFITSRFCEYPDLAEKTRRDLLAYCADRDALLLPMHFGAPHAGRVARTATGYEFRPETAEAAPAGLEIMQS
ncbi:glyoxylase-like metal-dependent hydrolase (beta-lactamase superfamily II) [Hoeflea marina]|uniref:Glyoxylase-like metal-dependent hydrolase (Beta-lactamase superfamily II) n=1 Tax=Hoeflea marina TaxID=274592 RepID=A0A317PE27_9HYPH|nr:MBL fold metallo-hydrolase [Hoeflea marina]PWV95781.1 glyoxylase-like metal-dependent hydrolase (beta-lactamase superfamily II) [Hoeflea marina]